MSFVRLQSLCFYVFNFLFISIVTLLPIDLSTLAPQNLRIFKKVTERSFFKQKKLEAVFLYRFFEGFYYDLHLIVAA